MPRFQDHRHYLQLLPHHNIQCLPVIVDRPFLPFWIVQRIKQEFSISKSLWRYYLQPLKGKKPLRHLPRLQRQPSSTPPLSRQPLPHLPHLSLAAATVIISVIELIWIGQ